MPPDSRPVLVVSYVDATLALLVSNLSALGVSAISCTTFSDAEKLALNETFNGILIDLTSIIKAKGEEKIIAYTLASVYPALRVRVVGQMAVPMAMPGDAKQDNNLKDFVNRSCAGFTPRTLRHYRRREKCISTVIKNATNEERGFTLNVSWGGAFIVSLNVERYQVGQEMVVLLHELAMEVKVRICWIQPWGQRNFTGFGVEFLSVDEELEKALFLLLKHDRSIDRDRISN